MLNIYVHISNSNVRRSVGFLGKSQNKYLTWQKQPNTFSKWKMQEITAKCYAFNAQLNKINWNYITLTKYKRNKMLLVFQYKLYINRKKIIIQCSFPFIIYPIYHYTYRKCVKRNINVCIGCWLLLFPLKIYSDKGD